jgi:hypothetical protein
MTPGYTIGSSDDKPFLWRIHQSKMTPGYTIGSSDDKPCPRLADGNALVYDCMPGKPSASGHLNSDVRPEEHELDRLLKF